MYLYSFLCGVAVVLAVETVGLLIAERVIRKRIKRMKHERRMTNADRIRAMTDEELAVLLNGVLVCDICVFSGEGCTECYNMERCISGLMTWLAMKAEEV